MRQTKGFAVVQVASRVDICRWQYGVAGCVGAVSNSNVIAKDRSASAAGVHVAAITVAAAVIWRHRPDVQDAAAADRAATTRARLGLRQ